MSTSWRPRQDDDIVSRPRQLHGLVDFGTDDSDAGTIESILFGMRRFHLGYRMVAKECFGTVPCGCVFVVDTTVRNSFLACVGSVI